MTDDRVEPRHGSWPPPPVPLDRFDVATINGAADRDFTMEMWRVQAILEPLFGAASRNGSPFADGFWIIAGAAMMVMSPSDPGRIWGPRQANGETRSPSPEDFKGEQNATLSELAPALRHPALRAHIADIAWTNDRTLRACAELAVNAYTESAERILRTTPGHPDPSSIYRVPHALSRALQIDNQTRRRGNRLERLSSTFAKAYAAARERGEPGLFTRLADLALYYKLAEPGTVAADAESAAVLAATSAYPLAAAEAFDLAADLFERIGDQPAKLRCQLASADRRLDMRSHVSSPGAEAHWVQEALRSLRGVRGADEQRRLLRRELRELQEDALCEMASFVYPLELDDQVARTEREFEGLDLADGLHRMLSFAPLPSYAGLRRKALDRFENGDFSTMVGIGHIDDLGRTAAITDAPGPGGPDENWIKTAIDRDESIGRQIFVQSSFEPGRLVLCACCDIQETHLRALVSQSLFVPGTQSGLVSLGLLRTLQGDFRSAIHLLVPQLEPCLRHLLRTAGHDPGTEFDDLTEEDIGLPAILTRFRDKLEMILPRGLVLELELLFHHRGGSALRHGVAHGRVSDGGCFSSDAIYACWFFFRLVGLPLLGVWHHSVAPAIRAVDGR